MSPATLDVAWSLLSQCFEPFCQVVQLVLHLLALRWGQRSAERCQKPQDLFASARFFRLVLRGPLPVRFAQQLEDTLLRSVTVAKSIAERGAPLALTFQPVVRRRLQ